MTDKLKLTSVSSKASQPVPSGVWTELTFDSAKYDEGPEPLSREVRVTCPSYAHDHHGQPCPKIANLPIKD